MYKKVILGIVAVIIIFGIAKLGKTTEPAPEAKLETVKIAYLPLVHGLPLYLAVEKGYFKDAGINAELVAFQSPSQIIDALLQGQVDITSLGGATGIVAIADFKNPGKVKIFGLSGGDTEIQNDALLVSASSTINSVSDLKGKKLGILTGSIQWQTIAKDFLSQNGLEVGKDVTIVDLPINLQAQALASGQIDALIALEPIPTVIKQNGIGREIVSNFTTKYTANPFYGGAGIIRVDFANKNPETAKKVLSVFSKAVDEIQANPDASRQYLKKYLSIDEKVIATTPISRFRMFDKLNQTDIEQSQKFMDIFTKYKVIDGTIDFKGLLYEPVVSND